MRRIAFLAVLFLLLVVVVDASILPALEVRAAYGPYALPASYKKKEWLTARV
jgi:hypothetical protein